MGGSKPIVVYRLQSNPKRTKSMKSFIEELLSKGEYIWYKDIFIEWSNELVVIEIYNESLIQIVKEKLVEELV